MSSAMDTARTETSGAAIWLSSRRPPPLSLSLPRLVSARRLPTPRQEETGNSKNPRVRPGARER